MPFQSNVTNFSPEQLDAANGLPADEAEAKRAADSEARAVGQAPEVGRVAEAGGEERDPEVAPLWLQRLSLLVLVLFCVYLGVLVAVLPWWTRMWDHNMLINSRPALAAVLHIGAVRGLISGLGLLDIWIGLSEAIHYRDHRR